MAIFTPELCRFALTGSTEPWAKACGRGHFGDDWTPKTCDVHGENYDNIYIYIMYVCMYIYIYIHMIYIYICVYVIIYRYCIWTFWDLDGFGGFISLSDKPDMRFDQHLFATLLRLNRGFSCETALLNRRIGRSFRLVAGSFVPICHMFYLRIDVRLFLSACGSLFHPHLPFLFRDRHQPPSQSPQRPRDPVVRIAGGHFSCIQSWIVVMDLYTCWHGLSPFLQMIYLNIYLWLC